MRYDDTDERWRQSRQRHPRRPTMAPAQSRQNKERHGDFGKEDDRHEEEGVEVKSRRGMCGDVRLTEISWQIRARAGRNQVLLRGTTTRPRSLFSGHGSEVPLGQRGNIVAAEDYGSESINISDACACSAAAGAAWK